MRRVCIKAAAPAIQGQRSDRICYQLVPPKFPAILRRRAIIKGSNTLSIFVNDWLSAVFFANIAKPIVWRKERSACGSIGIQRKKFPIYISVLVPCRPFHFNLIQFIPTLISFAFFTFFTACHLSLQPPSFVFFLSVTSYIPLLAQTTQLSFQPACKPRPCHHIHLYIFEPHSVNKLQQLDNK